MSNWDNSKSLLQNAMAGRDITEPDTLYIGVDDRQGGSWAVGEVGTIQDWRELAQSWADSDDMEETIENLAEMPDEDVIDYIADVWDIEIEEFDEDNPEHRKLQEERENW